MSRWPRDNQPDLIAFYGDPGSRTFGANLVKVVPPFRMTYTGKPAEHLVFHRLAAPPLLRALNSIWDYYGRDQRKIDALRISVFSGTYNPRKVRGSATKWSNHAYGAAIDFDAERNGFNTGRGHIPLPVVAAFKAEGFAWGADYKNRTDPMHFELCDRGEPVRTFEQWLAHYGCPAKAGAPVQLVKPAEPAAPQPKPRPSAAPSNLTDAQAKANDDETLDDAEPLAGDVIQEAPAKSMATSKIGVTQVVTGTATGITGVGAVAKAALENTSETINSVSTVSDQVGTVVTTTKTVVTAVPSGFWHSVLSVVTSPVFIACVVVVVMAGCALTWYWRRQYRQAGI